MSCRLRIFWLLSLLIFLSGCSGYRLACPTEDQGPGMASADFLSACDLKVGDEVRVTLVDEKKITGKIQAWSPPEITLVEESGRNNPRVVPAHDVLSIERKASYTTFRAVGLVLVLGALVVGGITIANNMSSPELKPLDLGWPY